ncbi:ABC transporter permease subunit [Alkalicoccobacillus porphyridii]|uniref:ABC transporter permease n=1 Tax=Alkalicoccobacillus porphyridii TaxID=2597270 RepID=A0A554A0Y8_9BACI|nr:ABC transporter permease subunit [Alkalicoccobacillus porphyridii]TSB47354.1 hypothetical protein FN960_06340 [Alkalicoccobacillus porphyridii]
MFRRFAAFETKLLFLTKRNWFLGLVVFLFFGLFYYTYHDTDMENLYHEKQYESGSVNYQIDFFPEDLREQPEGEEVYQNLLAELSAVNMQIWHLRENELEEYIEQGRLINANRLRNYELDNIGIHERLIVPIEQIHKDEAFLSYMEEHQLPLMTDEQGSSDYLVDALTTISGLYLFVFIIVFASSIVVYEKTHQTIMHGFPLSAINKILAKFSVYFTSTLLILALGIGVAFLISYLEAGTGSFLYPVTIYFNGEYQAVSTGIYIFYVFAGLTIGIGAVLFLTILLNMLVKNTYATIFIAIALFFVADLLTIFHWTIPWLHVSSFLDVPYVLSGEMALDLGNSQVDIRYAMIVLLAFIFVQWLLISLLHKKPYLNKQRSEKVA